MFWQGSNIKRHNLHNLNNIAKFKIYTTDIFIQSSNFRFKIHKEETHMHVTIKMQGYASLKLNNLR